MGRYISAGQIMGMQRVLITTAGMTPGDVEFFIETREDEIDARLGRYWLTGVWSGNAPPMIKTLAKLGATVDIRKSLISMEDPSISKWVEEDEKKFEDIITNLVSGTAEIVTSGGVVLSRLMPLSTDFWSSTMNYKPAMDTRDATMQHQSRTRHWDEQEADRADVGFGIGFN